MSTFTPSRERVVDSMVELARCSKSHHIIVAGASAPELMLALHCRGYGRVATLATCGLTHSQYGVAPILSRLGFHVEVGALCEHGFAISSSRRDATHMAVAA